VKRFDEAVKERKTAQLRPAEWTQQMEALNKAEAARAELDRQLREQRSCLDREKRLRQALPLLAKRRRLLDELQPLAAVPSLSSDFADRRRQAAAQLATAETAARTATAELANLEAALSRLDLSEALLQQAAVIQQVHEQLGAHRKAIADRPQLVVKLQRIEEEAQEILRELGRDAELQDAGRWHLSRAERARIQDLGGQHQALVEKATDTRTRLEQLSRDIASQQRELEQAVAPGDLESLQRAIRRAQRAGNLEERQAQRRNELQQLEEQAELDLQRLELWSGSLDQLERLAVPGPETVDRFETQWTEGEAAAERLRERAAEAKSKLAQLDKQIERLRLQQDPPTEDDLAATRQRRDAGWELVRRAWQSDLAGDDPTVQEFVAGVAPGQDLAHAYRACVERTDDVADRMRRESKQVAEKARLIAERQELDAQLRELAEQLQQQANAQQACLQEWRALWTACGMDPRTPREMRAWLGRQTDLLRSAAEVRRLRGEVAPWDEQRTAHYEELNGALVELGALPAQAGDSLADLLEHAEAVVEQRVANRNARRQAERDLTKLLEQRAQVEQTLREADAAVAAWREQWAAAVQRIELSAAASPSEANEVTSAIADLQTKRKEAAALSERIAGIDHDAEQFALRVRELATAVAPDLCAASADRSVPQILDRWQAAQKAQVRWQELQDQRRREEQRLHEARARGSEAAAVLAMLCQEAGDVPPEELPGLEQRSQQQHELRDQLRDCEDQLLELAAGESLDDFLARTAGLEADLLASQIAQHEGEIEGFERQKDELVHTLGRQQAEVARMDGSGQAAEAEDRAQALLAQIRSDAEQYVRLRLAAVVLQHAMERYREKNQGAVLQQASRWFAELTLGSFSALRGDCDQQGQPVLVGVRGTSRALVGVDGMSDGTRDQLYLALRLASLAHYLQQNEPLPFLVDDVLIQFDDQRAAAALRILAELSDRTQVIFFTHHAHLVQLAQHHVSGERLFVHPL
jgi:DNA repair exonuclease SbcCD ATPase subunit